MIALITKVLIILLAPGGFLYGGYLLGKHVQKKINDDETYVDDPSIIKRGLLSDAELQDAKKDSKKH